MAIQPIVVAAFTVALATQTCTRSFSSCERRAAICSTIYYKVPDLELAFTTLSKRDVQFEAKPHLLARMPDHDLWMAFLRDPDNNLIALMSEVKQ